MPEIRLKLTTEMRVRLLAMLETASQANPASQDGALARIVHNQLAAYSGRSFRVMCERAMAQDQIGWIDVFADDEAEAVALAKEAHERGEIVFRDAEDAPPQEIDNATFEAAELHGDEPPLPAAPNPAADGVGFAVLAMHN